MKIVAIIQARMGSTRLPGKILKRVLNKTLLEYQLERVRRSSLIDQIVIATTTRSSEEPIIQLCNQFSIPVFRGAEENVLERYYKAALAYRADIIVRLTSDCPLIDPQVIDTVIQYYLDHQYDYVSNTLERSFPRGMDTEVFSIEMLQEAHYHAKKDYEKEHVTPFFYLNPNKYSIGQLISSNDNTASYRLTVDTLEDFELISVLLNDLYPIDPQFSLNKIIQKLKQEPHLVEINCHIEQKKLGE